MTLNLSSHLLSVWLMGVRYQLNIVILSWQFLAAARFLSVSLTTLSISLICYW